MGRLQAAFRKRLAKAADPSAAMRDRPRPKPAKLGEPAGPGSLAGEKTRSFSREQFKPGFVRAAVRKAVQAVRKHRDKQGSTAHHKRGKAPGAPQGDPSRGKPQHLGGKWFAHTREVGGKPYYMMENTKTGEVDYPVFYPTGGVGYDRPEAIPPSVRAKVQRLGPPGKRTKIHTDQRGKDLAGAAPEGREYPPIPRRR